MKLKFIYPLFLLFNTICWSQIGFEYEVKKNKIGIPFQFINNLIIVPLEVNGTSLNFLLDTGVEETILFSLDESDQVNFENVEKMKFVGLGNTTPFDGLKSSRNLVTANHFKDVNHNIYLILDQEINMSSRVGIPVNGIIGYHFFKNHPIEINYNRKKIYVYKNFESISKKKISKYSKVNFTLEENKPYFVSKIQFENNPEMIDAKLLIDSGNSDAIWLFKEKANKIVVPSKNFEDYLGKGFSGEIYGKRGRLKLFEIGEFQFKNPIVAFPDSTNTINLTMVENRVGSIGSEILKRFSVIFDYKTNCLYLKKNKNFETNFNYNKSGIEIQHEGLLWVNESYDDSPTVAKSVLNANGEKVSSNLKYKFVLKPTYSIVSIRKNSPAAKAGLQIGDNVVKINNKYGYEYSLQEITNLFKSVDERYIEIEVERLTKILTFKLQLKNEI